MLSWMWGQRSGKLPVTGQVLPIVGCLLQGYSSPSWTLLSEDNGPGTSLVVQWLTLGDCNAGDMSSIPGLGTKIPHTL